DPGGGQRPSVAHFVGEREPCLGVGSDLSQLPRACQCPDDGSTSVDLCWLVAARSVAELDRPRSLPEAVIWTEVPDVPPGSIGERPALEDGVVLPLCDREGALECSARLVVVSTDDSGVPAVLGEQTTCLV